jgi:hypothetical protein
MFMLFSLSGEYVVIIEQMRRNSEETKTPVSGWPETGVFVMKRIG